MTRRPPRSTCTGTLFPCAELFRALCTAAEAAHGYGVVLRPGGTVDAAATAEARRAIIETRLANGAMPDAPNPAPAFEGPERLRVGEDRKITRLNSSH